MTGDSRSLSTNVAIFAGVNLLLLALWGSLALIGVSVHGPLWVWPVVTGGWALRIFVLDRRSRRRQYAEADVQRELTRIR